MARQRHEQHLAEKAAQKKTVREVLQTDDQDGGAGNAEQDEDLTNREGSGPALVAEVQDGTLDALISEMKTTAFRANARGPARRMSMKGSRPPDYTKARPWLK